jgi:hypothetical protein
MKKYYIIIVFLIVSNVFSQNKKYDTILFKNIPKANFMLYTPNDASNLLIYGCTSCSFGVEHIRNQANYNNYHDSFKVNKKLFEINELLDQQGIDFYNVDNNNKYLFVASQVSEPSKFSYKYNHYYLFRFNKKNKVISFKSLSFSKLNKTQAFQKLIE